MTSTPVPKVDAHHHLWDSERFHYPWLSGPNTTIARKYLVDDLLADAAGQNLIKSVHLQGEIARDLALTETEWLQDIADRQGFPHAIVAYASLESPDIASMLDAQVRSRNLRGIRQILNPDQCERADLLTDPAWQAGYARLAKYGLSFDLQADPEQMRDAAAVARSAPDVPIIVNHTGMPRDRSEEGLERWRQGLAAIAEVPHASIKISGFGMWNSPVTADAMRPLVLETIDIFGADRCMFASNFPVDKLAVSFAQLFGAFETITAGFSPSERNELFRANAERIYRI